MADRIEGSTWIGGEGGTQVLAPGGARAVWHSTEGDSIAGAVSAYRAHRGWPHATWDPDTGEVAQHLDPGQSARSVQNLGGGVETNRYGRVLQIEVVAHAAEPFTDRPMKGLDRVAAWLRDNGVPDVWPMGQPLAYGPDERRPGVSPAGYGLNNGTRNAGVWSAQGGHYAHSQVPENDHGDPGRVDIAKLLGSAATPQRPTEEQMLEGKKLDNGEYVVPFVGTDNKGYAAVRNPATGAWRLDSLGGTLHSNPSIETFGDTAVVLAQGDGQVPYQNVYSGGKWTGWSAFIGTASKVKNAIGV
jgi:hypothetical protein